MGGRGAAPLAAALWLGVLWGGGVPGAAVLAGAALVVPVAVRRRCRSMRCAATLLLLAAVAIGAWRGAAHRETLGRERRAIHTERLYRIRIEVVGPPQLASDRVTVIGRVIASTPPLASGALLRVRLPAGAQPEWCDRLECLAELDPLSPPRNPGGFDPSASADAGGWAATARALTTRELPPGPGAALVRATLVRWRRGIERRLRAGLGDTAYSLVLPLVTGDRSDLSPELDAELRAAGLIHLLALSGLHVSALAAVARALAASAGGGVAARGIAGALAALLYTGIAGPIPSLMRAAVSECWVGAARCARRSADPLQALGVSALLLLMIAPGWARDLGFQLSFAASLGLAALAPPLVEGAGRLRGPLSPLAATLAAQVVSAPILIAWTHGVSWPGALANLVAVPLSGVLLAAAWIAVLLESLLPGSGHLAFSACELLSRALIGVTERAAALPSALVATGHEPAIAWLAGAAAALLLIGADRPRDLESRRLALSPARFAALGVGTWCGLLSAGLAVSAREPHPPADGAWLVVLDVGQGDALALGLPEGWWLVDAGPHSPRFDAGQSVIRPFLRWAAVRRLEAMVLTHDDGDHTGGAAAVLSSVPVSRLIGPPPLPGRPGPLARFRFTGEARSWWQPSRVAGRPPRFEFAAIGDTLRTRPSVRALWPPRPSGDSLAIALATRSDNDAGLVLVMEVGGQRVMMLADVDSLVEDAIADTGGVALLKVGHHGSASSTGASWLARARPRAAVISCGLHNVYGHPSPLVLERLAAAGLTSDRTDRSGAFWYQIDARGMRSMAWRERDPTARDSDAKATPSPASGAPGTPPGAGASREP